MRVATFNLENLDNDNVDDFSIRKTILRPQLERIRANILCFQEVHGQDQPNQDREVIALKELLHGTRYQNFHFACTKTVSGNEAYSKRNLVTISEYPILEQESILRSLLSNSLQYNLLTDTSDQIKEIRWERPILYTRLELAQDVVLHVINVHLKSRNPTSISGQQQNRFTWNTTTGWAEGYFLSSMKRVGQAFETRLKCDDIFDDDPNSLILVCGDFNAHAGEVPVEAIAGRVENTGNPDLLDRVMFPCEDSVPESLRYTHIMLMSRNMMKVYRGSEIHNEYLHDESVAFAFDSKFPESDHAPFIAEFALP
jgi:endonuclease/exonuclease/phosphatase family metal-dependent hydrolase